MNKTNNIIKKCPKCFNELEDELSEHIDYPLYCEQCDENLCESEAIIKTKVEKT